MCVILLLAEPEELPKEMRCFLLKPDNNALYQLIEEQLQTHRDSFREISDYIYRHPELSGEEIQSATYLKKTLESYGFSLSNPAIQLPTAFVAEYGAGTGLTIAFVAEYDALPGFGPSGGPGHACGHNWIAASMCACAICMRKAADHLGCRIQVIGAPAEETFGAKYDLIQAKVFQNVDFVFQAHLDEFNSLETLSLAMNSLEFDFHGFPAHAAQNPEKGINALDAVIIMFTSVNAMRQQLPQSARIHGIITQGGTATNTIPEFAQCRFSIRAKTKGYLAEMRKRLLKIAEGAALSTGAGMTYRDYENPFDDMINVRTLTSLCQKHFEEQGISGFVPEEQYPGSGSSDIGNVSYVCPTVYCEIALEGEGDPVIVHEKSAMALVNSERAYQLMEKVVRAYTYSAIDLCQNDVLCQKAREEHRKIVEARQGTNP